MNRLGLAGLVAMGLVACSHPQSPATPPQAPPPPPPVTPAEPVASKPAPPAPVKRAPPAPKPFDLDLAAPGTATVKLVSPGKGKRVVAAIAPVAGTKAPLELQIDYTPSQDGQTVRPPTQIFRGDAEVVAADKDGTQYKISITGTDTHYADSVPRVPPLEEALVGVTGMTMTGTVARDGQIGKLALHHDAASPGSTEVMKGFDVELRPAWPVLPKEAIGPGAKWQVTTMYSLADVAVTEVMDYELVSYKDKTWTITGVSKVTGSDQNAEGAKLSDITGSGAMTVTLVDGQLIPTVHRTLKVAFSLSVPGESHKIVFELGNTLGAVK